MPPAPTPRRASRSRPGYRTLVVASLAAIVLSILASAPVASAEAPEKKCVEVKEEYDVRNLARDANVFLVLHEKDDKDAKDHICNKVEATPDKRWKEAAEKGKAAVFAYMEVTDPHEDFSGEWQEGNRGFAKNSLGVKSFPAFLYLSKGMDGKSKYSNHVTHFTQSDSLELADVENFIEKRVVRLGNDVYNIIFFDTIASRFISYGDATGLDRYKQRFLQLLVRASTLFSFREPFRSIGQLYNRAFSMSLEHGTDYCQQQNEKLQKKLDKNKTNMSQDKVHEFQQKMAVLRAFAEPKELTDADDRQILIHAALHLGLLVATIMLFVVPAEEEAEEEDGEKKGEEGEEGEEGEAVNAEPVVAKEVKDDKEN
ncbi:hypothetical protein ACHAXT_010251 [Thalassiosira profunda]